MSLSEKQYRKQLRKFMLQAFRNIKSGKYNLLPLYEAMFPLPEDDRGSLEWLGHDYVRKYDDEASDSSPETINTPALDFWRENLVPLMAELYELVE